MTDPIPTRRAFLTAVLLGHFLLLCGVKIGHGCPEQILWLSNMTLLAVGLGVWFRSQWILASSLINISVLHSLWLGDWLWRQVAGVSPLGLTSYLDQHDVWMRIVGCHHFYLLPGLLWWRWREPSWPGLSWLLSATSFVMLVLACRCLVAPDANINFAYFVPLRLQAWPFNGLVDLPEPFYLVGLHLSINALAFGPADCLMRRLRSPVSEMP